MRLSRRIALRVGSCKVMDGFSYRPYHWAFDAGLFTLASNYTVVLSPLVRRADIRKFEMVSLDGKPIHKPAREDVVPHASRQAMAWHRANVFRARGADLGGFHNLARLA